MANSTPNYSLEKATENEFYDVNLHARNMDKIDQALKDNADETAAKETPAGAQAKADAALAAANAYTNQEVGAVEQTVTAHLAETMPHLMVDHKTGKTYKYGEQIGAEGKPQLIYEEVV